VLIAEEGIVHIELCDINLARELRDPCRLMQTMM